MKNFKTTFFFLKLPVAISLAGHGLVRLPKLAAFSEWMVGTMEKSILPKMVIVPFSYVLPITEAVIGILLLVGFQTRNMLLAGIVLMGILIFGSCSIENWGAIEAQLVHALYLFGLFWFYDRYEVETKIGV